jgi:FtsP/CotA-like multicopper oxidase with cupredoxin domain
MIRTLLAALLVASPAAAQMSHQHHAPAQTPPAKNDHAGHGAPAKGDAPMASPEARGAQPLASKTVDGVREFELVTGTVRWHILPTVMVDALAYNGQVPGPTIRVKPGEKVRIKVTNKLDEPTSVHWHGIDVPFDQEGVAGLSQKPIAPGATHTYAFTIPNTPGTFMYHTHVHADRQQALGLYGAFIIEDPKEPAYAGEYLIQMGEWRVDADGTTQPAMQMDGMLPTHFTFNGKAFPSVETIKAKVGDRLLFRLLGTGQFIHPVHFHGAPFTISGTDGYPVPEPSRLKKDTVLIGPGERYDVEWTPTRPGKWMVHCHINHHATNHDGGDHGGMMMIIDVAG